jgi:hypothetical protein
MLSKNKMVASLSLVALGATVLAGPVGAGFAAAGDQGVRSSAGLVFMADDGDDDDTHWRGSSI